MGTPAGVPGMVFNQCWVWFELRYCMKCMYRTYIRVVVMNGTGVIITITEYTGWGTQVITR